MLNDLISILFCFDFNEASFIFIAKKTIGSLQTYQRRFLEHLLTGNVEKAKHLLEKGLDPNFQDERTGGQLIDDLK